LAETAATYALNSAMFRRSKWCVPRVVLSMTETNLQMRLEAASDAAPMWCRMHSLEQHCMRTNASADIVSSAWSTERRQRPGRSRMIGRP
jgi:hypothetical protein